MENTLRFSHAGIKYIVVIDLATDDNRVNVRAIGGGLWVLAGGPALMKIRALLQVRGARDAVEAVSTYAEYTPTEIRACRRAINNLLEID